jgi:hypothetical protein
MTNWLMRSRAELGREWAMDGITRIVRVRKGGKTRTVRKADCIDATGRAATFNALVREFGLDQAMRITAAAPGGTLPDVRHADRLWSRARFEQIWNQHLAAGGTRATFQTGRAAMWCRTTRRTIQRMIEQKVRRR